MASNRLNIYEAFGLAAEIRLSGPNLSEAEFARAVKQKGFYDAASAISADLRDFGLLVVSNSVRNLSPDCIAQLDHPSEARLRNFAARPSKFREYWRDLISGGSPAIAPPYESPLRVSSTVCGFLSPGGWNLPAIRAANTQGFAFGIPNSEGARPSVSSDRVASSAALGLELRYSGREPIEFPHWLTNLFALGCPPSPSVERAGGWQLTISKPIPPEKREWTRQWIIEVANSFRSGAAT